MAIAETIGADKTIIIDGKDYRIGELTLGDLADYEEHIRERKRTCMFESAKSLSNVSNKDLIRMACEPISDGELESEMKSISGARYLLFSAMRKHDPDVTLEAVGQLVRYSDIEAIVSALTGSSEDDDADEEGE